jgi:hypothetical protein
MAWSKRLIRKALKFWRSPRQERRLLLEALVLLPVTAVALRVVGFRRWQSFLTRRAYSAGPRQNPEEQNMHLAHLAVSSVNKASRFSPWPSSCLQQSLTLGWLLRRRGIDSQLRIGVRKAAGRFEAHAWVEHGGVVLYDPGGTDGGYVPFARPITPLEESRP